MKLDQKCSIDSYCKDIYRKFIDALERDKEKYAPEWITSWNLIDKQFKKNMPNPEGAPQDFSEYNGPEDLIKWFIFQGNEDKPNSYPDELLSPLIDMIRSYDEKIFKQYNLSYNFENYSKSKGLYDAQDYMFQNLYPVPERYRIKRILDFGAGHGRQANIWMQKHEDITYVGMDAIPLSYCLQHFYYNHMSCSFYDYVISPEKITHPFGKGIYHIPTWRADLLPDSFFDMVICVHVLQELNSKLVNHMIKVFKRILKPGGAIYIQDAEHWRSRHQLNIEKILLKSGFVLEFKPHIKIGEDFHGIPRIWRKIDPANSTIEPPWHLRLAYKLLHSKLCPEIIRRTLKTIKHRHAK
ncbi:MAG: class I SAM-dependent methyltransferase [Candidatus Omnitrophica bacterium]|nr:class I SAM-dependent methyltransferase [Candidatus Omnitrophota bacterium]